MELAAYQEKTNLVCDLSNKKASLLGELKGETVISWALCTYPSISFDLHQLF